MSDQYLTNHGAGDFIEKMQSQGHLKADDALIEKISHHYSQEELPLYIRVLIGVGAFISSIFISFFLFEINLITSDPYNRTFWGFLFLLLAIGSKIALNHGYLARKNSAKENYILQSSFTALAIGKALLFIGLVELINQMFGYERGQGLWVTPSVVLMVTAASYFSYRLSIDRFLSSLAFLYSVFHVIIAQSNIFRVTMGNSDSKAAQALWELAMVRLEVLILFELMLIGLIFCSKRVTRDFNPIGYAAVCGLFINLSFLLGNNTFGKVSSHEMLVSSVLLGLSLVALIYWLGRARMSHEQMGVAALGVLVLVFFSMPGVMFSLAFLILGYALHDRILIWFGGLSVPCFVFYYYYSLELTLLVKSGVLIGSGLALLCGYSYMVFRGAWQNDQ